jgi:hypothetical protein
MVSHWLYRLLKAQCYCICNMGKKAFKICALCLTTPHVPTHRQLEAPDPGQELKLVVRVTHKEYGQFFYAELVCFAYLLSLLRWVLDVSDVVGCLCSSDSL